MSPPHEPDPPLPPADFVRFGLWFYGAMALIAVVWRTGLYGESILYAGAEAAERGIAMGDPLIGVAVGGVIVWLSSVATHRTKWGEGLARALAESLGPVSTPNAVLLAFASGLAEEMLFRGALQPRVGFVAASLLFGLIHFAPRRELLPWTVFAIAAGFVFGGLFAWTGNLVASVVAHTVVNAVNLPKLVREFGPRGGPTV